MRIVYCLILRMMYGSIYLCTGSLFSFFNADYPFYDLIDGKFVPRQLKKFKDFKSLEIKFQNQKQSGHCSDGEIVFKFSDEWAWFAVKEFSSEEGTMTL